jgi:homoserine O-acetyltransferase
VSPGRTDLYFPPEDSEIEVSLMKHAKLAVIESCWGHIAGAGDWQPDNDFVAKECGELLDRALPEGW